LILTLFPIDVSYDFILYTKECQNIRMTLLALFIIVFLNVLLKHRLTHTSTFCHKQWITNMDCYYTPRHIPNYTSFFITHSFLSFHLPNQKWYVQNLISIYTNPLNTTHTSSDFRWLCIASTHTKSKLTLVIIQLYLLFCSTSWNDYHKIRQNTTQSCPNHWRLYYLK